MAYATLQEVRDEGVTVATASDARVNAALLAAGKFIDRHTGWFFERTLKTIRADGPGTSILHLPFPVCQGDDQITEITYGYDTTPSDVSLDDVLIHNTDEDRENPKIRAIGWRWPRGGDLVSVTGYFGYVDWDGDVTWTTPAAIKDGCIRLVVRMIARIGREDEQLDRQIFRLTEDSTKGRKNVFGDVGATGGPTGDPDIDLVVAAYKRAFEVRSVNGADDDGDWTEWTED